MKVFVVMQEYGWGDSGEVKRVFSSNALAQKFVSELPANQRGDCTIEDYEVDADGE